MYTLLSGSPVYDTAALANSATPPNTSVLILPKNSTRQHSPDWDDAAIDASFANGREQDDGVSFLPETLSAASPSPCLEFPELDGVPITLLTAQPHLVALACARQADVPATPIVVMESSVSKTSSSSSLETPSAARKCKDPFEQVWELTATYTHSRLESERVRADSKRQRLENELNIQQLKNEAEDRQRQHEAEEHERQRQHELQMMEKQIILAQLHAGNTNVGNANTAYVQTGLGYDNYSQGF